MSEPADLGRRHLLASALFPGLERWLEPLTAAPSSWMRWFQAIRKDEVKICRALLQRGFDPNTLEPERSDTGLILAVREGAHQVFKLLLATPEINLDLRSANGDNALMIACFKGDQAMALALIEQGAEINRPGWTALHYAAASGSLPLLRALLDHDAYIDAASPNQTTVLMMAARGGHGPALQLLLEAGADAQLKNALGQTAYDFAQAHGHTALLTLLPISGPATLSQPSAASP